ncbi:hypothetical protein ACOJIV_18280 [Haloarcula sp. AONF1]
MGASDWAGSIAKDLEAEFGTCIERSVRLTSLIRWFASNPEYREIDQLEREGEWDVLTVDLPTVLRDQPGSSIEERWNTLMDKFGYQELADGGVYLQPWDDYDTETHDPQVCRSWEHKDY